MKQFLILALTLSIFLISPLLAIDIGEREIKSSKEYHFGEGRGEDEASAREAADNDLMSKIQVSISHESKGELTEVLTGDDAEVTDVFSQSHTSYTGLYLRGLDHLTFEEKKAWRVVSFIQVDSLEASFNLRRQKIVDMIERAHKATSELRIGDALKGYYWAFLVSHTYPYTIRIDQSKETGCDPKGYISSEIISIIKSITVESKDCYKEADVIMAPLQFYYKGNPVQNLRFAYFDGEGKPDGFIENGVVDPLPLYHQPTNRYAPQSLCIEYIYANEMRLDPEIKNLYEIFKSKTFISDKSVRLAFPWIPGEKSGFNKMDNEKLPDIQPSPEWSRTVRVLADAKSSKDLFRAMENYRNLDRIRIGTNWREVAEQGWQVFCAVYGDDGVSAVLFFNGCLFKDVKSGTTYTELGEAFGGKHVAWFSERI